MTFLTTSSIVMLFLSAIVVLPSSHREKSDDHEPRRNHIRARTRDGPKTSTALRARLTASDDLTQPIHHPKPGPRDSVRPRPTPRYGT